jgi:hypothetical protein
MVAHEDFIPFSRNESFKPKFFFKYINLYLLGAISQGLLTEVS